MKARKLTSVLLALLLALAIVPMTAGAAGDPFCTVGTASYDDLAAAAAAASSSGQPILIAKDFDYAGQLELDGLDVAIELRGFTLNVTQASETDAAGAGLCVRNGGALTVNGPGTLNFKGSSAGIYVGSADTGDYGTVSITGNAAVNAAGSHGVVSNNSLNEVQVTGALGGFVADTYCVYCVDGKVEVFGSITSPLDAPPVRNGIYAGNTAEVHVYGSVVGFDVIVYCPAAAAANVWILGFGGSQHMVTDGAGFDIKIGGARAEGYSTSFTYPGYTERFRIQKYSGANAAGMDPGYPLGYIFESRVWIKIPDAIVPEPITGVTSPVAGAAPSLSIDNGTHFTAEIVWWLLPPVIDYRPAPPDFDADTVYAAVIKLTANPGYIFSGLNSGALIAGFTVNGIAPELENYAGFSDRVGIELSITFPATGEFPVIPPGPVTGVTSPVLGAAPSRAIDSGTNYTAYLLGWSPEPTSFGANTVYTATIQLAANPGYGFSGLNTDALIAGFTVNGIKPTFESLSDKSDRLTFSIAFPATDDFPPLPPTIATPNLPGGVVGTAYSYTLAATGDAPITWSIAGGALPDGLELNTATGEITGTPTAGGTASFTVKAANNVGDTTMPLSIAVSVPPAITTESLPGGKVRTAYSQTLAATGDAPITWGLAGGALPAGLSLNPATGEITGTPTAAGTANFTVMATNGAGSATRPMHIEVSEAPAITTESLPGGTLGMSYYQPLTATGAAPITWSIAGGALPAGLSLNTATGEITGTPTAKGTAKFTVKATNGAGDASRPLSIEVRAAQGIFGTNVRYQGWWWYIVFYLLFGFLWMWF